MDFFVALAPSALGVDGAALVCLWVKALRARAATRLQAAWRGLLARLLRRHLARLLYNQTESWDVTTLYCPSSYSHLANCGRATRSTMLGRILSRAGDGLAALTRVVCGARLPPDDGGPR